MGALTHKQTRPDESPHSRLSENLARPKNLRKFRSTLIRNKRRLSPNYYYSVHLAQTGRALDAIHIGLCDADAKVFAGTIR